MNLPIQQSTQRGEFQISQQVTGKPLILGSGFDALSFKHDQFQGLMDPLVMMDHYTMSSPTFGAHPHAGISALSILFEDSEGVFNNRDSLGNNIDLLPGDSYWLKAGSGAVHDEKPTLGSKTHGLQIFVNLPKLHKHDAPAALHVPSHAIPIISGEGYRVRVVFGESNGIHGATSPALPFTALDAFLEDQAEYSHQVAGKQSLVVYAVSGDIDIKLGDQTLHLPQQRAIAIQVGEVDQLLSFVSTQRAHFVILQGTPINEQFIQKGPFVMSNINELQQVSAAYEAGLLGSISE
ncbi:MAG: pirin-like C-terminal cupin domain-containing protein [Paraglaciecola sp.]|uniref:pirin family protein n=1 Tax=Paraglaciecola sp. TaxID=1920173 RepID=UPI00329A4C40